MKNLPSVELLSEVLGRKIWKVLDCNMGILRYCIYPNKGDEPSEYIFPINICEIANKCIEQAEKLGYTIIAISDFDARHDSIENYDKYHFTAYVNMNLFPELNKKEHTHLYDISKETRQEAILSAFEWILETKD